MPPPRFKLMDTTLHLDPDIEASIALLQAQMAARQGINLWLSPNFHTIAPLLMLQLSEMPSPSALAPWTLTPGSGAPTPPWTLNAGPLVPRAGDVSDALRAVYKVPAMQSLVTQVHDEALRQLKNLETNWKEGSAGDKAVMVSMSTVVLGGMLTPILANQRTRTLAFDLIKGHDIPVPGVDGLSFKILDHGAGVKTPLGVPGLSGEASLNGRDYEFKVELDVIELLKSRKHHGHH
ncbi:MAG: hypothetical protein GC186_07540 [Rhodobacteraceae bacterium]|nr:hypothetical protein [Paracoccaceae bacterium]